MFLFLFTSIINAKTVESLNASIIARNYFVQVNKTDVKSTRIGLEHIKKKPFNDTLVYYIFNVNQTHGWIIVADVDTGKV